MGRGRAKAKQTKVARDLKYKDQGTDLTRLADELHHATGRPVTAEDNEESRYSQWSDYDPVGQTDRSA